MDFNFHSNTDELRKKDTATSDYNILLQVLAKITTEDSQLPALWGLYDPELPEQMCQHKVSNDLMMSQNVHHSSQYMGTVSPYTITGRYKYSPKGQYERPHSYQMAILLYALLYSTLLLISYCA